MDSLVIATANQHKLDEISALLSLDVKLLSLQDFPGLPTYDEPYLTFVENALHKARFISQKTGLPTLSDDSGLCVSALSGRPGVLSARYTALGRDADNRKQLLQDMEDIQDRAAFFVCVIVCVRSADDPCPLVSQGFWQGSVALEERGSQGFGYDSIFEPLGYDKTVAEMSAAFKKENSHRKKAITVFQKDFSEWI